MSIKNLVFSGAEVRGISYIGVIKAIEELDIAKSIETILGVSSGAIFALTMALGLTSRQLEQIILSISIEHIIKFVEQTNKDAYLLWSISNQVWYYIKFDSNDVDSNSFCLIH